MQSDWTDEKIREAYWFSSHSVDYIVKSTGIKLRDIHVIAGPLELACPHCSAKWLAKNRTERGGYATGDYRDCLRICSNCYDLVLKYLHLFHAIDRIGQYSLHAFDVDEKRETEIGQFFKSVGIEQAERHYNYLSGFLRENILKIEVNHDVIGEM
jgi:DNA-directed RNA polymerase subunit RPC12/RpoP